MARQPIYLVILLIFTTLAAPVRALPQLVIDPKATACGSTGSLSGQLTDLQQQPLVNTEVQLFRDQRLGDWSSASIKRELSLAATQMTDNQGKFRFDNLSPDAYSVYATPADKRYATSYFGGSALLSQAQLVNVVAQHETLGVNIALPNAITISGTVQDKSGTSIAGIVPASVKLSQLNNGQTVILNEINTDSRGRYQFDRLGPGTYTLTASKDSYQSEVSTMTLTNNTTANLVKNFQLGYINTFAYLKGSLVDIQGKPLPMVLVTADKFSDLNEYTITTKAFTDVSGRYELALPKEGQYKLHFLYQESSAGVGSQITPYKQYYQQSETMPEGQRITVGLGTSTAAQPVKIPVNSDIVLKGIVKFANSKPTDDHRTAQVELWHFQEGNWKPFAVKETVFGSNYDFNNVPDGEYRVGFVPTGYRTLYRKEFYPNASSVDDAQTIQITAGKVQNIDIELDLDPKWIVFSGQFDLQGQTQIPEGEFSLERFDLGNPNYVGERFYPGTNAQFRLEQDKLGKFKLFIFQDHFGVGPFKYRLGYAPSPSSPFVGGIELPQISKGQVINNLTLRLALKGPATLGGQIKGRLLDSAGKPIANENLYLYGYDPENIRPDILGVGTSSVTAANGSYQLNGLSTGFHLIGTQAEVSYSRGALALYDHTGPLQRYPTTFYNLKNTPKMATGLNVVTGIPLQAADMRLSSGGCIAGQVIDARGQPLAHVRVKVTPTDDPSWLVGSPSYTDADGRYQVTRLNPGQYQASFERADLGQVSYLQQQSFTVVDEQKTTAINAQFLSTPSCRDNSAGFVNASGYSYDRFSNDFETRFSANFYDAKSKHLTLQRISVNGQLHRVHLKDIGNYTFEVLDVTQTTNDPWPSIWGEAGYDVISQTATLPWVNALGQNYCVQLARQANGLFQLKTARLLND